VSSLLPKSVDAVVVGAGIIGASVAYHLAKAGVKVLVIEKEKLPGTGSTAAAAGGIRTIFDNENDVRYALETLNAMENFKSEFGWDPEFRRNGYLFLASREDTMEEYIRRAELCNAAGSLARHVRWKQISSISPELEVKHLAGGVFTPNDGYCDQYGIMMGFLTAARRLGARIAYRTELAGLKIDVGKVVGIETQNEKISCDFVVNCAGPFAARVAAFAGLTIPAYPHRRYVFVTGPFPKIAAMAPLVINEDDKFYYKPESGVVIMSGMEEEESEPDDTAVRWERSEAVAERALKCSPVFAEAGFARSWAGLRTLTPDRRAILGETRIGGFYLACGFSGHGICHCLPAGRVLAEYITTGRATDLSLEPYFLHRFGNC
jgi:sarcosine oxidase subunit beta